MQLRFGRRAGWLGLAAGAGDELGGEDEAAVLVLDRGVGFFQEELGGGLAELVLRLADRGQGHGGVGGEVDVVVADDGQVSRDLGAELAQRRSRPRASKSLVQNAAVGTPGPYGPGARILSAASAPQRVFMASTEISVSTAAGSRPARITAW